eukprot:TRINITY_DN2333_c0_g1_i1.p1 TRINITY_DN2333_c0_g1~~TRINITY_DN2333_c0_g1_i1.p1  ORF type:complete len:494 (+),score=121.76 TRINITY_DN2333_c0_g1_i1:154-1482(+)
MSRSELTASTFIPQAESTLASFMSTIGEGGYDSLRDSQQKRARLYVSELRRMDQMLNVLVVQYVDDPVRLEQLIGLKECFDTVLETYGATVPTEAGQELPEVTDEMLALAMPPSAPTPASVFTSTSASSTATTASGAATSAAGGSADLPQERERPDPPTPREDDEEVECSICYDEQRWGDMVELGCYHRFCKECVAEYLNKKIEVADVVNIQCLDSSCDWPISSDEIRDLVDADAFKKFERFSILASIRTDPTARYCCKPECEGVHVGAPAPGSNKITCPECGEEMCYECSRAWHEGFCKPRKLTKEERKTERWMRRKGVQNCPECGVGTVRFGGCPTIDCPECGHEWEWKMEGGEETSLEKWAFLYPRMVVGLAGAKEFHGEENSRAEKIFAGGFLGVTTAVVLCPLLPVTLIAGPPALAIKGGRKVKHCFEDVVEYFKNE